MNYIFHATRTSRHATQLIDISIWLAGGTAFIAALIGISTAGCVAMELAGAAVVCF